MNPDMMPIRWWEDEDYWEAYSIMEIAKMKNGPKTKTKKRDWLRDAYEAYKRKDINQYIKEDWLFEHDHMYDYEDWLKNNHVRDVKKQPLNKSNRYKEGQLVQINDLALSIHKDQVGLIVQSDLPRGHADALSVRVMWPDGAIDLVAEDDLQPCKSSSEGL